MPPLVMVGAFPPPVHGMAAINEAVFNALQQLGMAPIVIDLAASSLDRSLLARLARLPRVLRGLGRLAGRHALRGATLYMSVSGGYGQFYEIAFLLLARLRGMRIFLHHHSFAYLENPNALTRSLVRIARADAIHITLSHRMAERLKGAYNVGNVAVISNAVFLTPAQTGSEARKELAMVGFLTNITPEKGVFDFLDLMAAADQAELPLRGRLAGPFQNEQTERAVRSRLRALPQVEYVGPQYGAGKDLFYANIDALMFPTRYINEAEPVTLHEAMSRGIPVIAYGRGCIPEIVGADCGLVIDPSTPFVPAALAQLERWSAQSATFAVASRSATARFARTHAESSERWEMLLSELSGAEAPSRNS